MEDKLPVKDKQNFICDQNYMKIMKNDEQLFWSGLSYKINNRGKRQVRTFLLTNKRVLNVGNRTAKINLRFWEKLVKRSIEVDHIEAVTYSMISNNFVLHVPSEYDYYLCSEDKDEFLSYLLHIKKNKGNDEINFYEVEDIDLSVFTKKEGSKKEKYPPVVPKKIDYEKFIQFIKEKKKELEKNIQNTEMIYGDKGQQINVNSFEILKSLGSGYFGRVYLVEKKDDKQLYALKVISKLDIIKKEFFQGIINEKQIMEQIKNPFVVNLEYCFKNPSNVFFAMKFK